ncbi:hypothetical protein TRFO_32830 [Tritrichomonas foetus]|uniref:Peptidase M60 domain-containing protein n=1 Tax=Tritrichomonas foetus TaxID=1144522 RepID=A0A1J4JT75_9EUKA|nr:hypothetical protein TRFO_32830 [Tritrichomonas foetus]|eukprot:OHT00469.1 hypothetical protein TRFO_32830 [Tritrichomonas foetus]
MGCNLSNHAQTRVAAQRRVRQPFEFYDDENPPPPPPPLAPIDILTQDCMSVLQGLSQIYIPETVAPVVCLSDTSIPFFVANFAFDENSDPISLPIIGFSRHNSGRYIYFGSIEFLSHSILAHTETAAFIENLVTWGSDYKAQAVKLMLLGFPQSLVTSLHSDFSSYGYVIDVPKQTPKTVNASMVFIASNYQLDDELLELLHKYVNSGGTIVVFAQQENSYPINRLFEDSGLALAVCSIKPNDSIVKVIPMETLCDFTLPKIVQNYTNILDKIETKDDIDLTELDNIVSQLRYYISEMGSENYQSAEILLSKSMELLEKLGYESNGLICPDVIHSVIAVIVTEVIPRLNPEKVQPAPFIENFPGVSKGDITLSNINMRIGAKSDIWNTCGVWLPAGFVCNVKSDSPCTIQIGSHINCLLLHQGPWHRWPIVTNRFHIHAEVPTKISTPFGGMIYVLCDKNMSVSLSLSNVIRHPYYIKQKKSIWEETKNNDVPWAEMFLSNLTMTLPSEKIRSIENIDEYGDTLDKLVDRVYQFVGSKINDPRKVVFDVDVLRSDPIISEVTTLGLDCLDDVLDLTLFSHDLLTFLASFALVLLNGAFLDHEIEVSIAQLAGCHALMSIFPDESPVTLIGGECTKMFYNLWGLYTERGYIPFATSIQALMLNNDRNNANDAWTFFVNRLSAACEKKLRHLMDRFGQVGLLQQTSSDKLQIYQLDENEL